MGYTRWRTRGNEFNNHNNHPIRAGIVLGTHNGTIFNADHLFRRLGLPRYAEVDNELIFRLVDRFAPEGPQHRTGRGLGQALPSPRRVPGPGSAGRFDPGPGQRRSTDRRPETAGNRHTALRPPDWRLGSDPWGTGDLHRPAARPAAHRPAGRLPARRAQHVPAGDGGGAGEQKPLCRLDLRRIADSSTSIRQANQKDLDRDFIRINSVKKANIALTFSRPPRSFILF